MLLSYIADSFVCMPPLVMTKVVIWMLCLGPAVMPPKDLQKAIVCETYTLNYDFLFWIVKAYMLWQMTRFPSSCSFCWHIDGYLETLLIRFCGIVWNFLQGGKPLKRATSSDWIPVWIQESSVWLAKLERYCSGFDCSALNYISMKLYLFDIPKTLWYLN